MISVRELQARHPLTFPLGVAVICCLLVLAGLRVGLGRVRSETWDELERLRKLEPKAIEYHELQARIGSGIELLGDPDILTTWGVEKIAREAGLADRARDARQHAEPHSDLVERLVTLSLTGVHRRELVDNPAPDGPSGFLQRVEAADAAIKIKNLRITPNRNDPRLIDAKATFSAYEAKPTTQNP